MPPKKAGGARGGGKKSSKTSPRIPETRTLYSASSGIGTRLTAESPLSFAAPKSLSLQQQIDDLALQVASPRRVAPPPFVMPRPPVPVPPAPPKPPRKKTKDKKKGASPRTPSRKAPAASSGRAAAGKGAGASPRGPKSAASSSPISTLLPKTPGATAAAGGGAEEAASVEGEKDGKCAESSDAAVAGIRCRSAIIEMREACAAFAASFEKRKLQIHGVTHDDHELLEQAKVYRQLHSLLLQIQQPEASQTRRHQLASLLDWFSFHFKGERRFPQSPEETSSPPLPQREADEANPSVDKESSVAGSEFEFEVGGSPWVESLVPQRGSPFWKPSTVDENKTGAEKTLQGLETPRASLGGSEASAVEAKTRRGPANSDETAETLGGAFRPASAARGSVVEQSVSSASLPSGGGLRRRSSSSGTRSFLESQRLRESPRRHSQVDSATLLRMRALRTSESPCPEDPSLLEEALAKRRQQQREQAFLAYVHAHAAPPSAAQKLRTFSAPLLFDPTRSAEKPRLIRNYKQRKTQPTDASPELPSEDAFAFETLTGNCPWGLVIPDALKASLGNADARRSCTLPRPRQWQFEGEAADRDGEERNREDRPQ